MSPSFDPRSLPLYRQLALGGSLVLFIVLFLPWVSVSGPDEFHDFMDSVGESTTSNGWDGVGVLVGVLAIVLVAWEAVRLADKAPQLGIKHDLVTAGLAGLTALFGLIQVIRAATSDRGLEDLGLLGGDISVGSGFGTWLGLLCVIALAAAAVLAFRAGGGEDVLRQAQSQLRGDASGQPTSPSPAGDAAAPPAPAATGTPEPPVASTPVASTPAPDSAPTAGDVPPVPPTSVEPNSGGVADAPSTERPHDPPPSA